MIISRLWKGEVPLVYTYWIFGILFTFMFKLLFLSIENNPLYFSQYFGTYSIYAVTIAYYLYSIFIWVAIWRSANNYKKSKGWSSLAKIVVTLSIIVTIFSFCNEFIFNKNNINNDLNKMALAINRTLPAKIDDITQMYNVTAGDHILTYHYHVNIDLSKSELIRASLGKLKELVCNNNEMNEMMQKGVSFSYSYSTNKNEPITMVTVTKNDCK